MVDDWGKWKKDREERDKNRKKLNEYADGLLTEFALYNKKRSDKHRRKKLLE